MRIRSSPPGWLFGALLVLLTSCSPGPPSPDPSQPIADLPGSKAPTVSIAHVVKTQVQRRARAVGQLLADEEVNVSNEVAGRVDQINVDFGSVVRAGQTLVVLDSTEYQLNLNRAQAAVGQSLAAVGLEESASEDSVTIDLVPSVVLAQAMLEDAQTKLESAAQLVKNRDIPEQRYLEAQKTVERLDAGLREARDRVKTQIATVKLNRAQLAIEQERLSKTRLVAPFDGSVVSRQVSRGQFVKENSNLLTLVREDPLRLRGRVPESSAGLVRPGLQVRFQTDAHPDRWFETVISNISPVIDPATRTLVAEARVPNRQGLLKAGMFVTMEILIAEAAPALMVPQQAIFSFAGLSKIFLVTAEGTLSEQTIELGIRQEGNVEILGTGVREGDRVVISDQRTLRQGMDVQISGLQG